MRRSASGQARRGRRRLRDVVSGLAADVTPLRQSPAFRRLWVGETISFAGSQLTAVAVPVQVYEITHSSFDVGLLGIVAFVPLVAAGLFGGSVADAVDRRQLALVTSSGLMLMSAVLLAQSLAHLRSLWLLYLVFGVQSALSGIDSPARRAIPPRLLPPDLIPAATGLQQIGTTFGGTLGPLAAGVAIASLGLGFAYGVDVVTFLAALYGIVRLAPVPPAGGGTRAGLRSVVEGLAFLRSRKVLLMTFLVDINAMVFGMPRALFPALAASQFHGGSATVGLLYASPAIGALVGALSGGWFGRVRRQGYAVLVSVAVWGVAITGFGVARALWLGVVCLAAAGAADMVSAVFRNTILQNATPDELRGRLQGVFIVVVAGGPRLGDLEAGAVASAVSPEFSVVSGGLACLAGVALLGALVPSFRRYLPPADGGASLGAAEEESREEPVVAPG